MVLIVRKTLKCVHLHRIVGPLLLSSLGCYFPMCPAKAQKPSFLRVFFDATLSDRLAGLLRQCQVYGRRNSIAAEF